MDDRNDVVPIPRMIESIEQFPLDPRRANRCSGKDDDEPIAPGQRSSDFVVPLLSAHDVRRTVPNAHAMAAENLSKSGRKPSVDGSMAEKYLSRSA